MGPTSRASCLGLHVVILFLQSGSLFISSEVVKERHELCTGAGDSCRSACPKDWMFYKDNCYGVFDKALTWSDAEVHCQLAKKKSHLATFFNEEDVKEIASYISTVKKNIGHVWIGLYDPRKSGNWEWINGDLKSYVPWNPGEPNNMRGIEYCAHLAAPSGYKKVNDVHCKKTFAYICKYAL